MFDFSDSLPHFCLALTFVFHPHLPLGRLLFSSHICCSDDFCFAPFIRRNFAPSGLLHSFSTNHSRSSNLRLRIFHALVPHNLVYPELFFVPMSISTVVQTPIQSTIPQLVTQLVTQTERCSSPCFFMGVSIIECQPKPT